MTEPTSPQMPMGRAATRFSLAPADILGNLRAPGSQPAGPAVGMGGIPSPQAQPQNPYQVRMQDDGTSVYHITGPNGKEIIVGLNPPPKIPKAMQPKQPTQ